MRLDWVRRAILKDLTWCESLSGLAVAVAVPTGLRLILGPSAHPVPFVTYFPAILLAAVLLGWRWAAAATLLSAMIVNRVFLAKPWLTDPAPSEIAILGVFVLSCLLLILIGDMLRRVVRDMDRLGQEREAMTREMYHRVQNTLAVVDGLVRMMKHTRDVDIFREDLSGRIRALSRANRALQTGVGGGSEVRDLIRQATEPFHREHAFVLDGSDHALTGEIGHQLLLVLHELCTNALKHGALSLPEGRVTIRWGIRNGALRIEWREHGGPPVVPPTRQGLGTRLLAGQQRLAVDLRFDPTGMVCTIEEQTERQAAEAA